VVTSFVSGSSIQFSETAGSTAKGIVISARPLKLAVCLSPP
jgi:hypothetical protein